MARFYKRGDVWHASFKLPGERGRIRKSTGVTDKRTAIAVGARLEREAFEALIKGGADGTRRGTVNDALDLLERHTEARARSGSRAKSTTEFYRKKTKPLRAQLGVLLVADLTSRKIDRYIDKRRETVRDITIAKELTALRMALRLAARDDGFTGVPDPRRIMPVAFSPEYEPRRTALTLEQASALIEHAGSEERSAQIAFMLATGARWGECERATLGDIVIDGVAPHVALRGTKTKCSARVAPVVHSAHRAWLARVIAWARAEKRHACFLLFSPWSNVRRDLATIATRAGLPFMPTPNDLRRSFATQLRAAGVNADLLAMALGHTDSRMVERVYGRIGADELSARINAQLRAHRVGSKRSR